VTAPHDRLARDSHEIDALVTDRYLDAILTAHARGADLAPTVADRLPDPVIGLLARRLARDLPRVHPSFRFEEALAARLQEVAARMRLPLAAGGEDSVISLPRRDGLPFGLDGEELDEDDRLRLGDPRLTIGRPLLVGGALTSAALSIAGAVYVAWRIRRPPSSAMARAVRAVARTRLS
jgi:hypothetical protein